MAILALRGQVTGKTKRSLLAPNLNYSLAAPVKTN